MIAMVLIFIRTICPASNFSFNSFSGFEAFFSFSCLVGANEACVTFVLNCHFGCCVPSVKGRSRGTKAEYVRLTLRGKEGEEEGERGITESQFIRSSLRLSPAVLI